MDTKIFQFIGGTVNNAINTFVSPAAANLTTSLQAVTLGLVSLYIMAMGFSIIFGQVSVPISKFAVQALKIVFITGFVLAGTNYSTYVVGGFESLELTLATALNGDPAANIYQVIDNTLGQGIALASDCFEKAKTWHVGYSIIWGFAAISVSLATIAIVALGGASIIAAKFLLALLFAIGPFFIVMLLFPLTARFFDGWFSQTMNYTFVVVVISTVMTFAMVIFAATVQAADPAGPTLQHPLLVSSEIVILAFVMVYIMYLSYGMAAGLAGGLSMAALTYAHMLTPGRLARNAIDPKSSRRDLQSGMQTTARRHEHLIAGNSVVNPAYNQYMRQNIGRNWGRSKGGKVEQ